MLLDFDINKAIGASAYLIQNEGGSESMFVLLKKLYWADRIALLNWGKSITGDSFASLDKGPVVSRIYNLLKNTGRQKQLIQWKDVIVRKGNTVSLRKAANITVLSEREIEVLEEARTTINDIKGPIFKWLHRHCPEWKNPHGSSIPIDPSEILRKAGKTEEEIRVTEEANDEVRFMSHLLDAH